MKPPAMAFPKSWYLYRSVPTCLNVFPNETHNTRLPDFGEGKCLTTSIFNRSADVPATLSVFEDEAIMILTRLPHLDTVSMLYCKFTSLRFKIAFHAACENSDRNAGRYICQELPERLIHIIINDKNLPRR
jgi:hypothetical protein